MTITTTLGKLISLGISVHKAVESDGFDEGDIKALQQILEQGPGIARGWKANEARPAALQIALTCKAFGQALARHWGGSALRGTWWQPEHWRWQKELELRMKHTAMVLLEPGNLPVDAAELGLLGSLTGRPLSNPYYRALWESFSNSDLTETGEDAPISLEAGAAREFERYFRMAYAEELATMQGRAVEAWIAGLVRESAEFMRTILANELAGWGDRHVFGNVRSQEDGDVLPFMSLDATYIEPLGGSILYSLVEGEPIQKRIRNLLAQHQLVIVQADFGHGKSLSARRLARDLAQEFLSSSEVGSDVPYPVFIKCVRDVIDEYKHEAVVRTAMRNLAKDALERVIPYESMVFERPPAEQCTWFLLDGLDEIAFGQAQLRTLFDRLHEATHDRHRAVVFTRPGALFEGCLPKGTPIVNLERFDAQRITDWLDAWSRLPERSVIKFDDLPPNLQLLAATPILLLMIAMTWNPSAQPEEAPGQALLYERFFEHVARGKYDSDPDGHKGIHEASMQLLRRLRDQDIGELPTNEQDPVAAMLWMMSRIAWEAHVLAYESPMTDLQQRHVESILHDELKLSSDIIPRVTVGLLVALQYNPSGGNANFLFGHQSFREFLVARFWASQLIKLTGLRGRGKRGVTDRLMRARLLYREGRSFEFLCELLSEIDPSVQRAIRDWAEEEVNNDELSSLRLLEDKRSLLRESALAIGSVLAGRGGIVLELTALRTICAAFVARNVDLIVDAPYLQHEGAFLPRVRLEQAVLLGANLNEANLAGAELERANLFQASLKQAQLVQASLEGANLERADLEGAVLWRANLSYCNLRGANLKEANLGTANLEGADLTGANLEGAFLEGADLQRANLEGANLEGADLTGANLEGADLTGANLRSTGLRGANLHVAQNLDKAVGLSAAQLEAGKQHGERDYGSSED